MDDDFLVLESPIVMLSPSRSAGGGGASSSSPSPGGSSVGQHYSAPSLFYDESNAVVISVTQDSVRQFLDVVAVSMATGWRRCLRFARPELMRAIKFSPDLNVISALWEKSTTFEFVNLPGENQKVESTPTDNSKLTPYSYTCVPHATSRQPSNRTDPFEVYGCEWLTPDRLIVVTSTDVELLSCTPNKRQIKQLRTQHVSGGIAWYKWAILPGATLSSFASSTAILALFTKSNESTAQPLLIRTANIQPLSRFEIDTGSGPGDLSSTSNQQQRIMPRQQDVAMLRVYNSVYLVVLLLQPRAFDSRSYAELQLYQFLPNQNCFVKTRIVRLFPFDSLAIAFSVVDDLLIAHHQATQTCLIFDLNVPCEYDQFVAYYTSLVPPQPATWLTTGTSNVDGSGVSSVRVPVLPDLLLQVDVLEAWRLRLRTDHLLKRIIQTANPAIDEAGLCLIVAMGRSDQSARWQVVDALKRVLFDYERKGGGDNNSGSPFGQSYLLSAQRSRFDFISRIMPALATGGGQLQDTELAIIPDVSPSFSFRLSAIPSQSQLANGAFDPALRGDRPKESIRLASAALMEFIRAVIAIDRPVEFSLAELLVHHFSSSPSPGLFQLYQLLQYRVVSDSVPLACSMLALSRQWPAGYQLSLDMLRRLPQGRGLSHAAEVLLTSGNPPVEAVRLMSATQQQLQTQPSSGSPSTPSQFMATTSAHASLLAAVSSNSPNKSTGSGGGARSSPTGSNSNLSLAASTSPLSAAQSAATLQSMDPRKPLDFAVTSESPIQLFAILSFHQQQLHNQQSSPQPGTTSAWLVPYWEKMHAMNNNTL